MIIAVCIPSKGRAKQLQDRLAELLGQPLPENVEKLQVFVAAMYDDIKTIAVVDYLSKLAWPENVELILVTRNAAEDTAVKGMNKAYFYAHQWGADWFVHGHDDLIWREGWLEEALKVAEEHEAEVVGFNDGHTNLGHYAPHYMASRTFCEVYLGGHLAPPYYKSWWYDREVCEKAQTYGVYAPAYRAMLEHMHPDWGTAVMDETYRQAWPDHKADQAIYEMRRRHNFPLVEKV